jgi:RHS repeat-associated protein
VSNTSIDHLDYDGFGSATESQSSNGDRYKFTAREWDALMKLQYNRGRYYDPAVGRWVSQDPIGFDAGDSNLYRYLENNPTNGTDPTGLDRYLIYDSSGQVSHASVGVDTWQLKRWRWTRIRHVRFDYSLMASGDVPGIAKIPFAINCLSGLILVGRAQITMHNGLIADAPTTRYLSSPAQDRDLLREMRKSQDKQILLYNSLYWNCLHWALLSLHDGLDSEGEPLPGDKPVPAKVIAGIVKDVFGGNEKTELGEIFKYIKGLLPLDDNGKPAKGKALDIVKDPDE